MASALTRTREALHAVAEYLLAGPQYERSGTIRLHVTDGGFGTVAAPFVRLDDLELAEQHGARAAINGRSCVELAAEFDLTPRDLRDVYASGPKLSPSDRLQVDADAVHQIVAAFASGTSAFALLAPEVTPVLWPEHFDVSITLDEVNYGVAAPDGYLAEPYAYVGPFTARTGAFWNAPFGSARAMSSFGSAAALVDYFRAGQAQTR